MNYPRKFFAEKFFRKKLRGKDSKIKNCEKRREILWFSAFGALSGVKWTQRSREAECGDISEGDMEPEKIAELVERGEEHLFYVSGAWQRKRLEVLEADRWECQVHRERGRYRRAELVHHVIHLRDRPELGLEDFYVDEEGVKHRQLVSVCRKCHETVCHPERMRKVGREGLVLEERWD